MRSDGEFFRILMEIFNSNKDLEWHAVDQSMFTSNFYIDEYQYGISIRGDSHNGINFWEVAFTAIDDGRLSHQATGINKNQFKILGIVSNGVRNKIPNADVIYFTAKIATSGSETEYRSRVKLYSRIAHKIATELNLFEAVIRLGDETIFVIARTKLLIEMFKDNI